MIFDNIEGDILHEFSEKFSTLMEEIFSEDELQTIALEQGFYKRKPILTPAMFFEMLLYCANSTDTCSLEQCSKQVKKLFGVNIKKQSIDERFNENCVKFVNEVVKTALEKQLNQIAISDFLPNINKLRIKDSTRFNLPQEFEAYYKGFGGTGDTSKSGLSIQFEYDLKSGKILSLYITDGIRNDFTDANETKENIDAGDLVLRDLGYYSVTTLAAFDSQQAKFVSKLGVKTNAYYAQEAGKPQSEINFKELYKKMINQGLTDLDIDVVVGKEQQLPLRLVLNLVPEAVYQKRIREITKRNKERGHKVSEDYKYRCRFNLFITNLTIKEIESEHLMKLYRLRWQIELMFKNWKSILKLDKQQRMKYERFACVLQAKLLIIIINQQIIWNATNYYYLKHKKILSPTKCIQTLRENLNNLKTMLRLGVKTTAEKITETIELFSENHWKEKRKNRTNYIEIFELFVCNSDK